MYVLNQAKKERRTIEKYKMKLQLYLWNDISFVSINKYFGQIFPNNLYFSAIKFIYGFQLLSTGSKCMIYWHLN